ncbi:MAG: hypothetical protein IT580_16100, partial [Verrucomicrobiales bacterium]|nr:hypothetical protein [Verrucomicrobiales bacterium]
METPMPYMPATFEEFVADPRRGPAGVIEAFMPRCDGGAWPLSGSMDPIDRQKTEFLAAYYHLNRLHAELARWRAHPARSDRHAREVAILVRQAMEFRDRLEDQCAPIGFNAEPDLEGTLAANLRFQHARQKVAENHRRLHPQEAKVKVTIPAP